MKNIVFKPGSYNVATGGSQPGLDGMRFVMDTLVSKGLASTEDCCTYTLNGGGGSVGSVTTSFNTTTDTLTITVDGSDLSQLFGIRNNTATAKTTVDNFHQFTLFKLICIIFKLFIYFFKVHPIIVFFFT